MTNRAKIMLLPDEELARLLVKKNLHCSGIICTWKTSDDEEYFEYEDAIEHEIKWLMDYYQ